MNSRNKIIQISCDGGAATGKSTGAKMITKNINLNFYLLVYCIDMQVFFISYHNNIFLFSFKLQCLYTIILFKMQYICLSNKKVIVYFVIIYTLFDVATLSF